MSLISGTPSVGFDWITSPEQYSLEFGYQLVCILTCYRPGCLARLTGNTTLSREFILILTCGPVSHFFASCESLFINFCFLGSISLAISCVSYEISSSQGVSCAMYSSEPTHCALRRWWCDFSGLHPGHAFMV